MSIELKQAAQQVLDAFEAFGEADDFATLFTLTQKMNALRAAIQQAESDHARLPGVLKDHQIAAMVNSLRDIARQFHGHDSLRERIANVLVPALKAGAKTDEPVGGALKNFVVLYRDESVLPADPPLAFQCWAEKSDHAEEQCGNAYPGCTVAWVWQGPYGTGTDAAFSDYFGQQPATPEPVAWKYQPQDGIKHPAFTEHEAIAIAHGKDGSVVPLYTHPAPGVPDGVVRDAERYRWLRSLEHCNEAWCLIGSGNANSNLDAAIDAAMLAASPAQKT